MTVGGFGIGLWVCCGGMCVSLMMAAAFPRRKGGHEFYFFFCWKECMSLIGRKEC